MFYSRSYIGTIYTDKLFKRGLEEGPPNVEVQVRHRPRGIADTAS